MSAIHLEVELN